MRQNGAVAAPAVMISGHGTIADAVEATRAGAFDFLEKPLEPRPRAAGAEERDGAIDAAAGERAAARTGRRSGPKMIGVEPGMAAGVEQATMAARSDARVLLIGESGTGKELLAAHIHDSSPFALGSVRQSELRGHPDGADRERAVRPREGRRSPAPRRTRRGKFELADGGTIFLDEVGDLHGASQAKLLRVLQEGEFHRVGGEQSSGSACA